MRYVKARTSSPEGWYTDPWDVGRLRYWDGAAWTGSTADLRPWGDAKPIAWSTQVPWLLVIAGLVVVGALTLAWETVRINNSTPDLSPLTYCSPEWAGGRLAFDAAVLPWTLLLLHAAVALVVLVWGKTRLGPRRQATAILLVAVIVGLWGAVLMFNPTFVWFAQDYDRDMYCGTFHLPATGSVQGQARTRTPSPASSGLNAADALDGIAAV